MIDKADIKNVVPRKGKMPGSGIEIRFIYFLHGAKVHHGSNT